ncbi:MAG: hypothetical protein PHI68_02910, partial [Candidatus Cloacimonetes bacterium]|nr:hypothetical protein [Candidatus Cloacimonadota bacterium]
MKLKNLHTCEIKRYRQIAPQLCAVCPRIMRCLAFRVWYRAHRTEYINFVTDICKRFPEKYRMEVCFMAEKSLFIQIVDRTSGKIERITTQAEIDALSTEDKLSLSRSKDLFIITHRLEPIVKVEMKKTAITEPMYFSKTEESAKEPEPIEEITPDPVEVP